MKEELLKQKETLRYDFVFWKRTSAKGIDCYRIITIPNIIYKRYIQDFNTFEEAEKCFNTAISNHSSEEKVA